MSYNTFYIHTLLLGVSGIQFWTLFCLDFDSKMCMFCVHACLLVKEPLPTTAESPCPTNYCVRFVLATFLDTFPLSSLSQTESTSLISLRSVCFIPGYYESKISSLTEVYQHIVFSAPQVLIQQWHSKTLLRYWEHSWEKFLIAELLYIAI